jgi:hypothetical protein
MTGAGTGRLAQLRWILISRLRRIKNTTNRWMHAPTSLKERQMSFASLYTKQKENSKVVASSVVVHGKRRFVIRSTFTAGVLFWLGMNVLFLTRYHASITGRFLAAWEAVVLLLSAVFGLVIALRMWSHYMGLLKSDGPQ